MKEQGPQAVDKHPQLPPIKSLQPIRDWFTSEKLSSEHTDSCIEKIEDFCYLYLLPTFGNDLCLIVSAQQQDDSFVGIRLILKWPHNKPLGLQTSISERRNIANQFHGFLTVSVEPDLFVELDIQPSKQDAATFIQTAYAINDIEGFPSKAVIQAKDMDIPPIDTLIATRTIAKQAGISEQAVRQQVASRSLIPYHEKRFGFSGKKHLFAPDQGFRLKRFRSTPHPRQPFSQSENSLYVEDIH